MKREDVLLVIGVFVCIGYLLFVLSVFESLGIINQEVKKGVYKYYQVPLPKE